MLIEGNDIRNDVITIGACFHVFFNVCLHWRSFPLGADWPKSDSSVNGEPQGNWRWNSNSRDIVTSSPSFSRRTARAPRRACSVYLKPEWGTLSRAEPPHIGHYCRREYCPRDYHFFSLSFSSLPLTFTFSLLTHRIGSCRIILRRCLRCTWLRCHASWRASLYPLEQILMLSTKMDELLWWLQSCKWVIFHFTITERFFAV